MILPGLFSALNYSFSVVEVLVAIIALSNFSDFFTYTYIIEFVANSFFS